MDDFGVTYVEREHAEHLIRVLKEHYRMSIDWDGALYCGIQLDWDYDNRTLTFQCPTTSLKSSSASNTTYLPHLKIAHTNHIPRSMGRQRKIQYQQIILTPWMQLASNRSNKLSDSSYSILDP